MTSFVKPFLGYPLKNVFRGVARNNIRGWWWPPAARGPYEDVSPRRHPEAPGGPRRHPGGVRGPRKHPGGTQEAPGDTRTHLGGTRVSQEGAQEAPGGTQESRGDLEAEVVRNNRFNCRKRRDIPFRIDETSASVIIGAFVQQLGVARTVRGVLLPTPRVCT